jgi:DNA-binding HxlR family transcriptional regulator
MEFQTYDAGICIMTRVLSLMSGRWKPLILHRIRKDINRFSLLQKSMPKISKKILTEQLRELEKDDLITRTTYGKKAPYIVVYHLTEKGASLRSLMDELFNWGIEYLKEEYDEHLIEQFNIQW